MATTSPPPSEDHQTNGVDVQHDPSSVPSYSSCFPYLFIQAPLASDAIAFYKRAFGAEELSRSLHPKRKADQELPLIMHAHLKFGGVDIMLCDETEWAGQTVRSPASLKGTSAMLHVETSDTDAAFARALTAGAKSVQDVGDQPWGMRYGILSDPFGFVWSFGTPLKESHAAEEEHAVADGE